MKHSIQEIKLANGAKGLLINVPDATVMTVDVNFRAGDFLSPKGKWEVAHVLEHMVLGANKAYPRARDFQAEFQKNGAYMNASTGPHNLNYTVECADFEWERILDLLRLSIESPLLTDTEFKAEMGNVREELTGDLNHNFRQIVIRAREKFGLVACSDQSRLDQMKSIHVEDIRSYYAKTHVTQNMRFILAGNLAGRQKKIEEVFGSFELGSGIRFELPEEDAKPYDDVFYIEKPDLKNMYFFLSTFSNRVLSELEEDALHLVNTMLTGTLHSRILGEAREQGLAYDISSSFNRFKRATGWWFGAELTEVNTDKVFEIIRTELKRLLDGKVDDADVTAAQQFSLGRYQRSAQTVRGLANGYSSAYFFDEHIEDYFAYPDRIAAVTKADMLGVVSTMFKDEIWGLAIMGTDVARRSESLNEQIAALWQSQK